MAWRGRAPESNANVGPAPVPQRVHVFKSFMNQLTTQFVDKLSEEHEREVALFFNNASMYKNELAVCAELLGHQLKRERQLHGMLFKAADHHPSVASSPQYSAQRSPSSRQLYDSVEHVSEQYAGAEANTAAAQYVECAKRLQEPMVSAENEFTRICQLLQAPSIADRPQERQQERQPSPSLAPVSPWQQEWQPLPSPTPLAFAGSMRIGEPPPRSTTGVDIGASGWPSIVVDGADRNWDGIPDASIPPTFKQSGMYTPPFSVQQTSPNGMGPTTSFGNGFMSSMRAIPPMNMGPPGTLRNVAPPPYMQGTPAPVTTPWGQPLPMATAGIDTTGDGRPNIVFMGEDRNRDGIPDALQGAFAPPIRQPGFSPMATAGLDTTGDGRANLMVTGADRNRDGIPDVLQGSFLGPLGKPGFGSNSHPQLAPPGQYW